MSERPDELPEVTPLSQRDDRLGALLRQGNADFQRDIDSRRALLRLEEKRERQRRPLRAHAFALSLSALLLGLFYAWGFHSDGSLGAGSHAVPVAEHPLASVAPPVASEHENSFYSGQTKLPDGSSVHMAAQSRARWRRTHGGIRVRLDAGQVRCAVTKQREGKRFVVEAGGYSFVVLGTELKVERDARESRLDVFSGRVEVREGTRSIAFVSAGGSWTGPTKSEPAAQDVDGDASEQADSIGAVSPRETRKEQHPLHEKHEPVPVEDCASLLKQQAFAPAAACYGRQGEGTGLGAELALVELARLRMSALNDPDGAVSVLEEHKRRFASGVLKQQVEVALTRALAAQKRKREAEELAP
jgi:hypothetical protein